MAIFTNSFAYDIVTVSLILLASVIVTFKVCFGYWKRKGVYTPQPGIPFGNAKDLVLQQVCFGVAIKNAYDAIKKKGLKFGGYYFFMRPIFIPVDLDLIKRMMTTDFAHFTDHVLHVDEEYDPLSTHLFAMKGSRWKNLRMKLTPTFTTGKMKMMFQTLVDCSNELAVVIDQMVENKTVIEIKEIIGRFTTDIIGSCAFGLECNSLRDPNSKFRQNGKKFFDTSLKDSIVRLLSFTVPEFFKIFRVRSHPKEVTNFFMNVVEQTVKYREQHNIIRTDFMHLLLQIKNNVKITDTDVGSFKNSTKNGNASLTLSELAAQCFVFFIAGFETSSTTTTFCMYELCVNSKIQDKLREEIVAVLKKHNGNLSYDAIMEMTYMDKCVNETLRKYPPIPIHSRECTKTYKIPNSDVVLKKGAYIFIPAYGVQRDPEHYPDPDKFDPERFSEENKAKRHPAAWTPFGDGPRVCIGMRFGLMQTKVALARMLQRYQFSLHSKTTVPIRMDPGSFVLAADTGVWLVADKLNNIKNNNC
ncbi:hypothetical protein RN001_011370 [Aquatica leii]|uniref:Cytochrome P450 n=1 Tax=Aquatica leii TaxID=1421715 RepID=A0AAN7SGL9_9COLE|nr:hypothetical protein RN001_011370 [Aquatica leii]